MGSPIGAYFTIVTSPFGISPMSRKCCLRAPLRLQNVLLPSFRSADPLASSDSSSFHLIIFIVCHRKLYDKYHCLSIENPLFRRIISNCHYCLRPSQQPGQNAFQTTLDDSCMSRTFGIYMPKHLCRIVTYGQ